MEHDIHQPAESKRLRFRHAGDRLRVEHAVADDPELAGAQLGDEHAAIREKREAPGLGEVPGDHHDADLVLLGGVEHERAVAERRSHDADRSGRLAAAATPRAPTLTSGTRRRLLPRHRGRGCHAAEDGGRYRPPDQGLTPHGVLLLMRPAKAFDSYVASAFRRTVITVRLKPDTTYERQAL